MISPQPRLTFAELFVSRQFATFIVVGVVAAAAHWSYRYVANLYLPYVEALIIAYAGSLVSGFILTRHFVFPLSSKPIAHQASFFVLFHVSMFPIVFGTSYVLSEFVLNGVAEPGMARGLAHGLAVLMPAIFNFLLQKFVVFDA